MMLSYISVPSSCIFFLFQKRKMIEREKELNDLTPIMEYPGRNATLKTKDQVFSVIDTTLVKCYLNVRFVFLFTKICMCIKDNGPLNGPCQ